MKRLLVALALALLPTLAMAARRGGLEPQNRLHLGLSLTDASLLLGGTGGLDSRITRLAYVDIGGFFSATEPTPVKVNFSTPPADLFELRHGIYVLPGIRVPHRYGEGLNWDLTGRLGFGALWSSDASSNYVLHSDPALVGGIDLLLRYERVGLRTAGKVYAYQGFATGPREPVGLVRPQLTVEGVLQF